MCLKSARSLIQPKLHNAYWLQQNERDTPADNDWLRPAELAQLDRLRFLKRRADWRLGRWTAKCALAMYLNAPLNAQTLATIEISPAPDGAPEVSIANQPNALTLSLSHRGGVALCAVSTSGSKLGCDLELIEPRSEAFVADYFTVEEQTLVTQASRDDRFRVVALLWSAKESALKALRMGLRVDTRSVVVSLSAIPRNGEDRHELEAAFPSAWSPLSVRYSDGQHFYGWYQSATNYVRTLVSDPPFDPPILLNATTAVQQLQSVS
jgi:4'-phosphopantetheinyl transferase